ncbi:MAG: GNAT family N-acetyltransferase [Anaerolineales bacterium]|nr:GNAT family N-acetyltransferase [Anaerolineales bacterium]
MNDQKPALVVEPVTLVGRVIRLEPLSREHVPDLALAGQDQAIWEFMLYGDMRGVAAMAAWVDMLLEYQRRGTDLPFAVLHQETGRAIGATRYMEIRPQHRGLEIGGTWYTPQFQRTTVNTEAKYLLLEHAFERLGCIRVQFKTDLRNLRSQRAIERIGAVKEGVLRKQLITPTGVERDSVYYSILNDEWPAVKQRLITLLAGY